LRAGFYFHVLAREMCDDGCVAFHVYVEGAVDRSPDGVAKVATAIAAKFGLPAADIAARLAAGRFRVKSNVDRATADTFARTLQELGARAKIEEATPSGRVSSPALPPPALPRTTTGNKPASMSSGLSAAFSVNAPAPADLGALGGESLSLASLDGADGGAPAASFTSDAGLPASIGPAALPAAAPAKAKATPVDLFAPPEAEGDGLVELAADEAPRERTSTPVLRKSEPQVPMSVLGGTAAPSRELSRPMFAAGVLAAILVGFVPAHVVASVRETSAFTEIDNTVRRTQQLATDEQSYAALDSFRSAQLSEKQSTHRSIALTSMLLWAAISAGLAYVWFRRIPWHKVLKS
jgi:hypothetical protein